ncbi:MAG: SufE family protein [Bacteroidaceae bacterium]|nr:SufE family protein [Bacteroidaceae bacterium]
MSIDEIQDEIIEEFSLFDDWMDKYQMIIDLGNRLEPLDEKFKNEQNLIEGCQSRVWLHAFMQDGLLIFQADSDAIITKGLIALLIRALSGHTPQEILESDVHFIEATGLTQHLSPTRSNGLLSMLKKIKNYASAYSLE